MVKILRGQNILWPDIGGAKPTILQPLISKISNIGGAAAPLAPPMAAPLYSIVRHLKLTNHELPLQLHQANWE